MRCRLGTDHCFCAGCKAVRREIKRIAAKSLQAVKLTKPDLMAQYRPRPIKH